MRSIPAILLLFSMIWLSCSSPKWVVQNQEEVDRTDFELLESNKFLQRSGVITPRNPVIVFDLKAANTFEYALRVRTDRFIQRYSPTFASVALGTIAAGLSVTAALTTELSTTNQNVLFGTAGFIALASVLNMKAKGEPTPTGETRLLRKTGSVVETDTVAAEPGSESPPTYTISFKNELITVRSEMPYLNGKYALNLAEELNPENIDYDSSDVMTMNVYFNGQSITENVRLSDLYEAFVVISTEVTPLRDEPELDERNVLTDLAKGSQLKLVSSDSLWYKVLYGIKETWVARTDAFPIWRPSEFASQLSVFAVPNIPFGNVDVESNIPKIAEQNTDSYALLIANGEFQGDVSERIYASRDALLMERYLENALGLPPSNIIKAYDIQRRTQLNTAYNRLASNFRSQRSRLIVYLSGYVRENGSAGTYFLKSSGGESTPIDLNALMKSIAGLPAGQLVVFADLDNIDPDSESTAMIDKLAADITANHPNAVVIFGSTDAQRSRNFSTPGGDQKRHSIFTYFVADAIKKGESTVSGIINHLQRNVDYTSRRLHNQPQHVVVFGNTGISLTD